MRNKRMDQRVVGLIAFCFLSLNLWAQSFHALTPDTRVEPSLESVQTLFQQAFDFNSLQAHFVQHKQSNLLTEDLISSGTLYLTQQGGFRIDYDTPVPFSFWTNGVQAYNQQEGQAPRAVNTQHKRFAQMAQLFQGGVLNPDLFDLSYTENEQYYCCTAVPKQAAMKNMYALFKLYIEKSPKDLSRPYVVKMEVHSARKTEISIFELSHLSVNQLKDNALFQAPL